MESNDIIFKHKSSRDFITLDKQIIYDGMNNQKYIIYKKGSSENNNNVCSTILCQTKKGFCKQTKIMENGLTS